jgi:hypothetical protein
LVQGIFGLGGEAFGEAVCLCRSGEQLLDADAISSEHRDRVLVGGGRVTLAALQRAREIGASAVVAASARGEDLIALVGGELNPAATGDEDLGLTLVLTEGFGDLAMARATFDLLGELAGREVSTSGTTQVRAGVIRPEILGPGLGTGTVEAGSADEIGARVRIVRGVRFGAVGRIAAAPGELREIGSGSLAMVYELELTNGDIAVVPRANVEHLD